MTTNTDDIIKRLGLQAVWAETVIVGSPPHDNMVPLYTHSDLERVVEEVKARQEEQIELPNNCIKDMVDRFLSWKLPEDFNSGIFKQHLAEVHGAGVERNERQGAVHGT